jgi:acetyl-CoA C-acetyltransferase
MGTGWERFRHLDRHTPVIVGVGRGTQDGAEPGGGVDALGLMVRATEAAGADSGVPAILTRLDRIAVPEGTRRYRDAGRLVAQMVGSKHSATVSVALGIPQQALLNDCYEAMRVGRVARALVVGGEAAARQARARRAGTPLEETTEGDDRDPDERQVPAGGIVDPVEVAAGVIDPPVAYALIDTALRAAEGWSPDEHRDQIATLWSAFSRVAARFPHAAFPEERAPAWLREPSTDNRPIAFPYNKWHCSQMYVDQAAALLVSTLEAAEEDGVDPDCVVWPSVALQCSFTVPVVRRQDLHRWPAMEVLGRAAARHLGIRLSELPHLELYSCFPAAVRVQQRALGLPADGVPTITGGMAFAGGPFNNFVLQATVAMVEKLRRHPADQGLVTTVSGFLSKPGLAVYSSEPAPEGLLVADLAQEASDATAEVAAIAGYEGPATVVSYTVGHDRTGGRRAIVVADTPTGNRCVAVNDHSDVADWASAEDVVGAVVTVEGECWSPSEILRRDNGI